MKLSTKLSLIFACCAIVSIGGISIYSTVKQSETYIQNELTSQKQVLNLINNTVSGQYYSYINQQVMTVFQQRKSLIENAELIKNYLNSLSLDNDDDLYQYISIEQQSLNKLNYDLFVAKNGKIIIPPTFKDVLKNKNLNQETLEELFKSAKLEQHNDYFINLPKNNNTTKNYLAYLFKVNSISNHIFVLTANTDNLLKYYENNKVMLEQFRINFADIQKNLKGSSFIIDSTTNKVLFSTNEDFTNNNQNIASINNLILNNKDDNGQITLNDSTYIMYWSYYKPLSWYIVSAIERSKIISPAIDQAKTMISIGTLALIIFLLVSFLFTKRITKTLGLITEKAKEISKSQLSDPNEITQITSNIYTKDNDEVGILGKTIKEMGESLSENIIKLMDSVNKNNKIQAELNAARDIQLGMLLQDEELPKSETLDISTYLDPAKEVGGDFYDVFRIDNNKVCITIGDVSDKGVPAALFMSTTVNLARSYISFGIGPADALTLLNMHLSARNPNMMFVTMIIMIINEKTGEFILSNAGHCSPICSLNNKASEIEHISGPAVGAIDDVSYDEIKGTLQKDEALLLYTDGVNEAQNKDKEFFGTQNILKYMQDIDNLKAKEIIDGIVNCVKDFRKDYMQTDDITVVSIKRH